MLRRKEQQEVHRENGRPCGNQCGSQKQHLLFYAHSHLRYFEAEKADFFELDGGSVVKRNGGK